MNNFYQRILTAIIFTSIMIGAVLVNQRTFILLFFIINILGLQEFYRLIFPPSSLKYTKFPVWVLVISIYVTAILIIVNHNDPKIFLINIPLAFGLFIYELYGRSETPFLNLAISFLGVIYITIPIVFVIAIAFLPFQQEVYHSYFMIGFLLIVWASDTGAYIFGKLFGKHLLFKRISPKKTWEGSIGGAFFSLLVAYGISFLELEIALIDWIMIALIIIVIGSFGDLIKSLLKRSVNVKDSGTILPGHGGILDRFDSLLSSAPFVFCYLLLFK
jgi:phosphatidate cytidylyltransferase